MPRAGRRRGGAHSAPRKGTPKPSVSAAEMVGTAPSGSVPADPPGEEATPPGDQAAAPSADAAAPGGAAPRKTRGERKKAEKTAKRRTKRSWLDRVLLAAVIVVALAIVAVGSGYAYIQYRFHQVAKVEVKHLKVAPPGQPFNVLLIGSDSRVGESAADATHFGTEAETAGQRSDVVKIVHIVPATGQASVLSIPRDTMVTVAGNTSQTGTYNRINSTYGSGPDQLVQTIEANFGIPIEHVVQIDFEGFRGAVDAIGGINLDFPYPAKDDYTGLDVPAGCQHLNGGYSLAVARSRHYEYFKDGYWQEDPTSDLGRIQRQNAFLKALINQAESDYNPLTLNAFIGSVVQGITIDSSFTVADLVTLAREFHSFDSSSLGTETLPTYTAYSSEFASLGDVLYVDQSDAAPMIDQFLGGAPESALTPPPGPYGPVPATTTTTEAYGGGATAPTSAATSTTTTIDTDFDPTPC